MKFTLLKSIGFAIVAAFAVSSCNTDPCKDVVCGDAGSCLDGTCVCDPGFETDADGACTVLMSAKFIGSYSVVEDCSASAAAAYTSGVLANSTDVTAINFVNFWGSFVNPVVATIGTDGVTITIASQEPDADGYTVSGTGSIDPATGIITVSYVVTETASGNTDTCDNTVLTPN
jgi:hypothetical protein